MKKFNEKCIKSCVALAAAALLSTPAAAYTPGSSIPLAAPSPTVAGTGLAGAYWNANVYSNAAADSVFATTPTGTFLSPTQDYGGHSSVNDSYYTVKTYLEGFGATNLVGDFTANLETATYRFTGYINITSDLDVQAGNGTIDVNFAVASDDGMRLNIGGTTVTQYDSPRAMGWSVGSASFASAGLYAIELVYWENYGGTGLDFQWQTGSNGYRDVATANLYPSLPAAVPEPASLTLIGAAVAGILGARRRRV